MKNVGNNSRGRSQGVPKISREPMYRVHCAVIFAIAQLSCCITVCGALCVYVWTSLCEIKVMYVHVCNYVCMLISDISIIWCH